MSILGLAVVNKIDLSLGMQKAAAEEAEPIHSKA
jgi:hypothetical protein